MSVRAPWSLSPCASSTGVDQPFLNALKFSLVRATLTSLSVYPAAVSLRHSTAVDVSGAAAAMLSFSHRRMVAAIAATVQ